MSDRDFSARVLVVSDDRSSGEELRQGLPAGYVVDSCLDARAGWAILQGIRPDIVVVDLQTGSAGGFALARDMSQDPRLARVPVLMLLERRQDEWLARTAGATAFCVKPLGTDDLVREVTALVS